MKVAFDIHWTMLGWIAGSIAILITLAISFLLLIAFIPEIEEGFTRLRKLLGFNHDKS
jgi:hypothetical protein